MRKKTEVVNLSRRFCEEEEETIELIYWINVPASYHTEWTGKKIFVSFLFKHLKMVHGWEKYESMKIWNKSISFNRYDPHQH